MTSRSGANASGRNGSTGLSTALASDNTWDPAEDDERVWTSHLWGRRVRAAIDRHNEAAKQGDVRIPPEASAYSFRHARISELLQIHGIDPVTVAAQTGTSVLMLEKTYSKFIHPAMRAKITTIACNIRRRGMAPLDTKGA